MRPSLPSWANTALDRLFLLCCLGFVPALLYHHFQLVTFGVPIDYNEAGMLTITGVIAEGGNPHAFAYQPVLSSVYPVLYNVIVAPFTSVFGNTLPLHRAIAGLFILSACLFWFAVARHRDNTSSDAIVTTTLLYTGLLYYSTPISSPTGLGVFLFYTSLGIPWLYRFSNRSLVVAVILGVLAFYAKQYFVASLGYVALYLFLNHSKLKGVLFGISSLLAFLLSVTVVTYTSPYFLDNTVFAVKSSVDLVTSNQTLVKQLLEYGKLHAAILLILGLQVIRRLTRGTRPQNAPPAKEVNKHSGEKIDLLNLRAPLTTVKIDYFWFCLVCSGLVIVLSLGRNPGNHLSYLFQFLSPFLLVICLSGLSRAGSFKPLYQLLVIYTLYTHYGMLSHDFSIKEKNWDKIRQIVSQADDLYASTIVLGDIMASGKEVYLNGHTRYFYFAQSKPDFLQRHNPQKSIAGIWNKHVNRVYKKIAAKEFDVIILDQWQQLPRLTGGGNTVIDPDALLKEHYERSQVLGVPLANRLGGGKFYLQVWQPIDDSSVREKPDNYNKPQQTQ